ncbi:MAG: sugar-binding protein [Bacteroidota bacterium]
MRKLLFFLGIAILFSCSNGQKKDHQIIEVHQALTKPIIDGRPMDACWGAADWKALDQLWLGEVYPKDDFFGRYKLSWDEEALYLLVEVTDDVLFDQHKDPLELWWDDDCVEVFLDEDNSGGNHQYNHNAFAYHIALDGNVVDLAPDEKPRLYNHHVRSKKITSGNKTIWELAITPYADTYQDNGDNKPVALYTKKKMGFALAYCDNDGSKERENFIGSVFVPGEDKNQGCIDANIFGTLVLK